MQPRTETPEAAYLIPERAHQQLLQQFPLDSFGKQQRAFGSSWYNKYPWLHYQEADDSALCFYCLIADKHGLNPSTAVHNKSANEFIRTGFSNWKKALEKYKDLSSRDGYYTMEELLRCIQEEIASPCRCKAHLHLEHLL